MALNGQHLILCTVYISPNSAIEVYPDHCAPLESVSFCKSDSVICVVGDFNLHSIKWQHSKVCVVFNPFLAPWIDIEYVKKSSQFLSNFKAANYDDVNYGLTKQLYPNQKCFL